MSKSYYYELEMYIDFKVITNMDIKVISGFQRSDGYTYSESIEQGKEISFSIYNTTWIMAIPKPGQNYTRFKFEVYIERNVAIWSENYIVRTSITAGVMCGGVMLFILGFLAYV